VAGFALLVNLVSKNNSFQDNHGFLKPAEVVAAKMDLTVDCNDLNNAAVTTILNVVVSNSSDRTFNDVTVKVIAYDNNNNIIKEKYTTFSRVLRPFGTFSKPVTLPERTAHCTCNLENIN
jgi:hypothetical protein